MAVARLRPVAVTAVALGLTLTACSGGGPAIEAAPPVTEAAATSTTSPPTTAPATSTTTSTTTSTSTSTTSTTSTSTTTSTTAAPLPQPIAPPTDEYGDEPVVELGTISIPKIGVEMTMYEGIRLTTLDRGPGHWPGSAMPGQPGNVVVAGHRVSKHRVFRNVGDLVAGDEIVFTDATGRHVYAVDHVQVVEPTEVWIVEPTPTPTATLFACHPPGSTRQRIVVFANLIATG